MPDDEEEIMNFREELDKLGRPNQDFISFPLDVPCEKALAIAYYFPISKYGDDMISKDILKAKGGDWHLSMAFGLYAAKMMDTSIKYDCVVRALNSTVTIITNPTGSMDYFSYIIALAHSAHYRWDLLRKKRPSPQLHKSNSLQERIEALTDNYYCTEMPYDNILVVDDIATSGTTAKAIYEAIIHTNPRTKVSFLMIGRTVGDQAQVAFDDKVFQSCVKCCEKWCLADLDRWSKI